MMKRLNEIEMFESLGYAAGVVGRSDWGTQERIYDFLAAGINAEKSDIIVPKQTHSADIAFVDNGPSSGVIYADGLLSESADICLTVRTADCIPLIFAEPSGLFGIVHVGWRGFAAGIIDELFVEVRNKGYNAENSSVYIGPSIGKCCFEVGDEVAVLFDYDFVSEQKGRFYVDLPKAVGNIISSYGVKETNVGMSSECTCCDGEKFYSYRREGAAPIQMVSYIRKK
ncbi:MAG: polyphenol oxidase family protein [candidate division Zixibacteria bacterium]